MEVYDKEIPLVEPEGKLEDTLHKISSRRTEHALVTKRNFPMGIISIKDVANRIFLPAEEGIELLEVGNMEILLSKRNTEVMTSPPITAYSVREAVSLMIARRIGIVPLVKEGEYRACVTERSLLKSLFNVQERTEGGTRAIITAERDTTIGEVMEIMSRHNIRRVPLRDESGNLSRIVTLFQIISWLLQHMAGETYDAALLYEEAWPVSSELIKVGQAPVGEVARTLYSNPESGAVIVEDAIVTERDMLRYVLPNLSKD